MLATLLCWSALALGQESTEDDDAPLAIPAPGEPGGLNAAPRVPSKPAVTPPPVEVKVTAPQSAAERASSMRKYRDEHLALRRASEFLAAAQMQWGYPAPQRWGRMGWSGLWPRTTPFAADRLGVVQGHQWLDVPAVLAVLGEGGAQRDLERRIRNQKHAAALFQGVAIIGVAGIVTGLVGSDRATSVGDLRDWQSVTVSGIGLTIGGLMMSAVPTARADKLRYDVTQTFSTKDLRSRIASHNEALAAELGLPPEAAVELEGR